MCNTATYLHLTHQMTAKKQAKQINSFGSWVSWFVYKAYIHYTCFSYIFLLISMKPLWLLRRESMSQGPWLRSRFSSLLATTPDGDGEKKLRPRKSHESGHFTRFWRLFCGPISGFPLLGQYEILTMGVGNEGHFTQRCPWPLVNATTTFLSCFYPSQMRPSWEVAPLVRKSPSWAISFDYLVDRFPAVSLLWVITQVE